MGLPKVTIDFIMENIGELFNKTMLELGNQRIRKDVKTNAKTGKEYFGSLGCFHLSIDQNGQDGAMVYDLSKPLPEKFRKFDVVTNIGTSAYVDNQFECFQNIHYLTKIGGKMIHVIPEVESKWNSKFYYDQTFIENLAKANKYKIIKNQTIEGRHGKLRAAVLVKSNFKKFNGLE